MVYEHPSIEKLSEYLLSLQSGTANAVSNQHEAKMLALLEKWTAKLTSHMPAAGAGPKPPNERVIVSIEVSRQGSRYP